jgi:hypothetical protein
MQRFSDEKQLSDHLGESIIDAKGLAAFRDKLAPDLPLRQKKWTDTLRPVDVTQDTVGRGECIYCCQSMRLLHLRYTPKVNDVFRAGAKIQTIFNNGRKFSGLSPCVATYVVQSIDNVKICRSCANHILADPERLIVFGRGRGGPGTRWEGGFEIN